MAQSLYRQILRQAYALIARHKTLWFLGFLATLLGTGGQYEFLLSQYLNFSEGGWDGIVNFWPAWPAGSASFLSWLGELLQGLPASVYLFLVLLLGALFLLVFIIVAAQGALVLGVAEASTGRPVRLGGLLYAGYKYFWRLLAVLLATRILALVVLAVVGLPLLALIIQFNSALATPALTGLFFVLALPLLIVFSIVAKFAVAYCLIEGEPWRVAIVRSLTLFAGHWLVAVEMALALFVIYVVAVVAFVLAAVGLSLPFLLLGLILGELTYVLALSVLVTVGLVLFLFLILLAGSALAAWQNAAWTLLFLKIKTKPQLSKLVRIVHGWREKYS